MKIDLADMSLPLKIGHLYQPMWNIEKWDVFGYTAIQSDPFSSISIDQMDKAIKIETLFKQDTMLIINAIERFPVNFQKNVLLFIHLHISTIFHDEFKVFIHKLQRQYPEVTCEIVYILSEKGQEEFFWRDSELKERVTFLKKYGFKIALCGIESFITLMNIKPNYLILNRSFGSNLYNLKGNQHFLSGINKYAKNNSMELIIDGVEKEIDLAQAKILQVLLVQGDLFGAPISGKSSLNQMDYPKLDSNVKAAYSFWMHRKKNKKDREAY